MTGVQTCALPICTPAGWATTTSACTTCRSGSSTATAARSSGMPTTRLTHNMKSRNILSTCSILVNKYNSKVPDKISELLNLPGVGRKTANVVVSNAYGIPAIAVDTHVFRVTNRIGVVNEKDVFQKLRLR